MNAPSTVTTAKAIFQHHAKSFWLASLFLPSDRRDDAAVIYAFCRLVDDAADEAPNVKIAELALAQIDAELNGQKPARPIIHAFLEAVDRLQLPLNAAKDLMRGVRTDLEAVRIADDWHLAQYSYRVAGTVGLLMCGVLGVRNKAAYPYAVELGIGMQMTNICRDVLEDARRDRVYLPKTRLEAAGSSPQAVLSEEITVQARTSVVSQLLHSADVFYERANFGMHFIPFRTRVAIVVASTVYREIGHKLRKHHQNDPFHGRTIVSSAMKLWCIFKAIALLFSPTVLGLKKSGFPSQSMFKDWGDLSVRE
ncbi:MAG: phytoene/squalene synthase family protein [Myxococcota bacterium]|nr:phytoene/squalene synthase family protein [Myxococcota bacterium]